MIRQYHLFFITILFVFVLGVKPASALLISDPLIEFSLVPGEEIKKIIKITNDTKDQITIRPTTNNFTAKDENGGAKFTDEKEGLASWIQIDPSLVTLNPGEREEKEFSILVPEDAIPGSHYAAIFWESSASPIEGGASLVSKTGHLILLRVAGQVIEDGKIVQFGLVKDKKMFSSLPIDFLIRFENLGTVHLKPYGQIQIKNIFGQQSGLVEVNTITRKNVLTKSIRRLEESWQDYPTITNGLLAGLRNEINNFGFGFYTASVSLVFGSENKQVSTQTSFWIIPWRLIILTLVLLIVFSFLLKMYNRFIIKRAMEKK